MRFLPFVALFAFLKTIFTACVDPNCASCVNDICEKCADTFTLFPLGNVCFPCDVGMADCQTCSTTEYACEVCSENFYLSSDDKLCYPCDLDRECEICDQRSDTCNSNFEMTPVLYWTDDPLSVELDLGDVPPGFAELLIPFVFCSFPNNPELNSTQFFLTEVDDGILNINMLISTPITNSPLLRVEILLPPELNDSIPIAGFGSEINLMDNYALPPAEKAKVEEAGKAGTVGSKVVEYTYPAVNLLLTGNSLAVKGLVLMEQIQLFRFVNLNYPPSVNELFKGKRLSYGKDIDIQDDGEDGKIGQPYRKYDVSIYILYNCGSYVIAGWVFFCVGLIVKCFSPMARRAANWSKFPKRLQGWITAGIDFLNKKFVWNFAFNHFLSQYQLLLLLAGVALKFPTENTHLGRFNFAFAIISTMFLYTLPVVAMAIVYKMIKQIEENKNKSATVMPISGSEQEENTNLASKEGNTEEKKSLAVIAIDTLKDQAKEEITNAVKEKIMDATMKPIKDKVDDIKNKTTGFVWGKIKGWLGLKFDDEENEEEEEADPSEDAAWTPLQRSFIQFHKEFKPSTFNYFYIILEMWRQVLIAIFILAAEPEIATVGITISNGLIVAIVILRRPHKSFFTLIKTMFMECSVFICCVGFCFLAFNSTSDDLESKKTTGWAITVSDLLIIYSSLVVQYLGLFEEFWKWIKGCCRKK